MKLTRVAHYPIFLPDPTSDWETYNVFNPAVVYHNGLFHMIYRAQGLDWISRLGYAVSPDGLHWNRMKHPILEPKDETDSRGIEDPRITQIGDTFYMTYTAYGSVFLGEGEPTHLGGGILPMIARSKNLITWERMAPIVVGENNKDHVLFPRKIRGRYAALHRRWPQIWIAYSDDLMNWPEEDMAPIFGPHPDHWDSASVGANGVPIETDAGWLLIYHGYDEDHIYRFGLAMLDLEDPTHVLARIPTPIFWPEELWELRGDVPQVVFSNANPVVGDTVYVFYGGGDHVIGLATARLDDLVDFVMAHRL